MTLTWSELCLEYPQLPTQVRGSGSERKQNGGQAGPIGQALLAQGRLLRGMSSPWRWWEAGGGEAEET